MSSPRAKSTGRKSKKTKAPAPEADALAFPGGVDPHSDEFRAYFPWTAGEMCDSYTSIEAMLRSWFEREGIAVGHGALMDLAVRVSACVEPFRSHYRASQGWHGYDLEKCREKAKMAEESL